MPTATVDLHARARRLSSLLGWPVCPRFTAALEVPGGGLLHLGTNWQGTKLQLHCFLPDDLNSDKFRPYYPEGQQPITEISVATSRPDEAVANEVKRRLLPGFLRFRGDHEAARERIRQRDAATESSFRLLAQAVGFEVEPRTPDHYHPFTVNLHRLETPAGSVFCSPGLDGMVTLELELNGSALKRLEEPIGRLIDAMRRRPEQSPLAS